MKKTPVSATAVLKNIDTFIHVANTQSFQYAADHLHVTVSAVSRRIKQLEDELGVSLLDREANGTRLTNAGRQFLQTAETVVKLTQDSIRSIRNQRPETVRVVTLNPIGGFLLMPHLKAFESAHPAIELDISVHPDLNGLTETDYDISLTVDAIDGVGYKKLATFVGSILCSPNEVNNQPPPTSVADLHRYTLLCYSQTPDLWQRIFASFGQPMPEHARLKMYNDGQLLLEAAAHGLGVAVGTAPFASSMIDAGALVDPFNRQFSTGDGIVLKYGRGAELSQDAVTFANWVGELIPAIYREMTTS